MKRLTSIASIAFALMAAIAAPALAGQPPPVVGANLVNEPYKQTALEQDATFQALQAAGVHVIRAGIPDNDQGLAFAQRAYHPRHQGRMAARRLSRPWNPMAETARRLQGKRSVARLSAF